MGIDIIEQYGPGMSFYRSQTRATPSTVSSANSSASSASSSSLEKYTDTLNALNASNENLDTKMAKLRSSTVRLSLDLSKLGRHIKSFHHELLITWQADMLTRLIEVIHMRLGWKLPGGIAIGEHMDLDRESLSRIYSCASRKITRGVLKRRFGLTVQYYVALQKYSETVDYRSSNPFRTEYTFAQWVVSEKENNPGLYRFWARLFPLCYGRTVEESSERADR